MTASQIDEACLGLPKSAVTIDPDLDLHLVSGWNVDLTNASIVAAGEVLGLVKLALGATTPGFATAAGPRAEAAADQGPPFTDELLEVSLVVLPQLEELLTQAAGGLAHEPTIRRDCF